MNQNKNVREVAVDLLEMIEKNQSYSNLLLNSAIKKNKIVAADIGLLTELVYGTLQRRMTLDFYLEPFLRKKVESWVRQLLRLTLYQLVYLDKIPDHAAIYEGVEIAKKRGHKGISRMVNGVLRNIQRKGLPDIGQIKDEAERISIESSHPLWLVKRWIKQLGLEKTKEMCEMNLTAPLQTARVNTTKTSRENLLEMLREEGFLVEPSAVIPEAIKCLRGNLASSTVFKEGYMTIQDESSMVVAYALDLGGEQVVLDACAAPGGKSTHIAERISESGHVVSLDLHEHKVKLIKENASRLGLGNIDAKSMDSREAGKHFAKDSFDRILLDAPCSGLGVMRRKPDLKYTKKEEDISKLHTVQLNLLHSVKDLLKKGGILVYSTCTVDEHENKHVVEEFLAEHPEFEGDPTFVERLPEALRPLTKSFNLQILPQDLGSDGFYIACLRKKV